MIEVAQSWEGTWASSSTRIVTVSGIQAGDLLIAITSSYRESPIVPTDNAGGNTWTSNASDPFVGVGTYRQGLNMCSCIVVNPPTTVTLHDSTNLSINGVVLRVTGFRPSPSDQFNNGSSNVTSNPASPSIACSSGSRLYVAALTFGIGASLSLSPPTGYTLQQKDEDNLAAQAYIVATKVAAAGTEAPQWVTGTVTNPYFQMLLGSYFALETVVPSFSGNEITDATRRASVQGDGLAPEQQSTGIWTAATNLQPNGGAELNTSGWVALGSAAMTRDSSKSKFGSYSVKAACTAALTDGLFSGYIACPGSTACSFTAWMWIPKGSAVVFNLQERNIVPANFNTFFYPVGTGEWQKVTIQVTTQADTINAGLLYYTLDTTAPTFWVDGVQHESTANPTPYIETSAGSASRLESLVTFPSTGLSTTQMWVAMRVRIGQTSNNTGNNTCLFSYSEPGATPTQSFGLYLTIGTQLFQVSLEGTASSAKTVAGANFIGEIATVIGYFTATTLGISKNGSAFATTANLGSPSVGFDTIARIGGFNTTLINDLTIGGEVFWLAAGTGTLTDANAKTIAGFNNDPKLNDFPGGPTYFWDSGPDGPQQALPMGMLGTGRV